MEMSTLVSAAVVLLVGLCTVLYALLIFWTPPSIITRPSEKKYQSYKSPDKPLPLPSLSDPGTVDLSVVVPAYNETERLPTMMAATIAHLTSSSSPSLPPNQNKPLHKRTFEILIVDDGSTDGTAARALELAAEYKAWDVKVVRLEENTGKGGAVRHGMLHAAGKRLLMVDADGASRFADLEALWDKMDCMVAEEQEGEGRGMAMKGRKSIGNGNGEGKGVPADAMVVVGSRAHLVKSEAVVKRSLIRNILMYGLHTILRIVGVGHIRDTQCGFKLFSRAAARQIFPAQHLATWIFDVELLLLAKQLGIPVAEVPIEWHEVAGSKLNVMTASLQMLRDLLVVRANHLLGRWKAVPVG
ncbi:glycosyltransferase family 2 protein [Amanita thiersii Skay4041]|uniref:dolichyl-phosphate beta-glucosyltransferase n=1 Tax=Amanita thiersii Skay4041 TaxID=703135 RepID=A0A2A9NI70_9AGAR|nr:glycosyltransferase family 2 protein [Amanita thiersii Skay4041]